MAAPKPAARDSFGVFLRGLADSSDAYFGGTSVSFDTTGLDSVAGAGGLAALGHRRDRSGLQAFPVVRFHRAEGQVLGAGVEWGAPGAGTLSAKGAYGFANRQGRYELALRRTLLTTGDVGRDDRPVGRGIRLELRAAYARATFPFAPEHAQPLASTVGAAFTGRDRQSVFEERGSTGALTLLRGSWRVTAGVRDARDRPMARATRFTLIGPDARVPWVTRAQENRFTEPFGSVFFERFEWDLAARLDARGGGPDRWRLRAAAAEAVRLGSPVKLVAQVEAGAAAPEAPIQRRFELGGPVAMPSLGYGVGDGAHLLLGKLELAEAHDFLCALHLPHPDLLVLTPAVFVHGGAVWDDAAGRSAVFVAPPRAAWRGSAGFGFLYRPGVPDPRSWWRLQMAWPIGPASGTPRFALAIGRDFDLVGRP